MSAQVAVWFVEASPEATLQNLQRVLVGEGTLIENIRVSYAVRVLREVAERQSIRNAEEGFKLQLQADLEKHASFTHKIVSGKSQPVQLPTESLHGAKSTSGKWSQVWRNAPVLDLEELVGAVGQPTDTCSEDAVLYTKDGWGHLPQSVQGSL